MTILFALTIALLAVCAAAGGFLAGPAGAAVGAFVGAMFAVTVISIGSD